MIAYMVELLSTNKPEVTKKPEVKMVYNDRSYQSWVEKGFADHVPHRIEAPHTRIEQFLSVVDTRKGPIERTVTSMVRQKAIDYDSSTHERKEYIYYEEDWEGKNWLGNPVTKPGISGHIEGKHIEVLTRPKLYERTGEHIDNVFAGTRERYYIPFTKKNVDEIIANSAHTDKSNIRFVVKFGKEDSQEAMAMSTRNEFSYDMFLLPWDKLYEWQYWPQHDLINRPKANVAKSSTGSNQTRIQTVIVKRDMLLVLPNRHPKKS